METAVNPKEVATIYVEENNRFIVSLIVGYGMDEGVNTANEAAAAALSLTRDIDCQGTIWYVYDRQTGTLTQLEQRSFDDEPEYWELSESANARR